MYKGETKLVLRYLDFLTKEYGMTFEFQTFEDYNGFCGPIDTYSFYNDFGCFTLHNIVQKGEWHWYVSKTFSNEQTELLKKEIDPNLYISAKCFLYRTVLKRLALCIKEQVATTGTMFGIKIRC